MKRGPRGAVLPRQEILRLLSAPTPLLEGLPDLEAQLQPNGVDLSLRQVALFSAPGRLGRSHQERQLAALSPLAFDALGWIELMPGAYLITFNEVIHLPRDLMALGQTRSSLLRCGVSLHNAVWDAGYSGRSQALMVVYNPYGFRLQQNARILQLVFFRLTEGVEEGYHGHFQGENL